LTSANEKLYLGEDIRIQERFCDLLAGFSELHPCYTRTSLKDKEISDLLSATRDKIGKLKKFLKNHKGDGMNEA